MSYPNAKQFVYLTNSGAHFATKTATADDDRKALQVLLKHSSTPKLAEFLRLLKAELDKPSMEQAISLFNKNYIAAKDQPLVINESSNEDRILDTLKKLSDTQHCAICDQDGFLLFHTGFDINQAEQAALLAVEISDLQTKRQQNMQDFSGTESSFISITDNDGQSQLRFWPMHFNAQIFFLAIKGNPLLNDSNFTHLTWLLSQKYL